MEKIKNIIKKFPKKIMRRFFGIFAVCWLSLAIFSPNVCYAVDDNQQNELQKQEDFKIEIKGVINMLSQIIYIFLWPLLVIAWTALDNTLVYGKFLNLDAALWDIWNIMKNVANFALWFVFIFAVVKNLFKTSFWDGNPLQDAVKVIKSTLLSWILIQMSWFLLGVLLDLSTILIYAIWGLPLSMLGAYNTDVASVPIMELHTNINENSSWSFYYYYSYWDHNFSPCFLVGSESSSADAQIEWYEWRYIAWRKYLYLSWEQTFDPWYCVLYGYPYQYVESSWFFRSGGCTDERPCYIKSWTTLAAMNASYYDQLKNYIHQIGTWGIKEEMENCSIIAAYGTGCELSDNTWTHYWAMSFTWDIFSSAQWKLDSLLESSKWWVWPLITMYSSILKVQELLVDPGNVSTMSSLFWAIINTFFVVILFIPIAILAILLIIRIWFLWVTIAISPILILINLGPDPINKLWKNDIFKKFTVKETLIRIFSPIAVVFAVSLSIIFLATIHASKPEDNQKFLNSLWVEQNCEWNRSGGEWWWNQWSTVGNPSGEWSEWAESGTSYEDCRYTVSWLVDLKINLNGFNHWKDVFVWCLMMLLSTWIVRFFMKFAIWVMWEKWKELMKSSEKFLGSLPIVPLPGGWAIGINKVSEIWLSKRLDNITNSMDEKSRDILQKRFPWAYPWAANGSEGDKTSQEVNAILDEVRAGKEYDNLNEEQKTLLKNYYWWDAAVATQIVNNIYTYNTDNSVKTTIQNAITKWMEQGTRTNADALTLTASQLDMAVKNDSTWISWAKQMIWWAVHTRDWVRIVDTMPWTAEANNPVYTIVTRDDYEKHRFGNQPETLTKKDFDGRKDEDNAKYQKMDSYLKEMDERYKELQGLQGRDDLNENEKTMLAKLRDMFDSKTLERLQWLDPAKFIQVQTK